MSFVTDMNDRERKKFIWMIELHIKDCEELRDTIKSGDDVKMMVALVRSSMSSQFTGELIEIVKKATSFEVPEHP